MKNKDKNNLHMVVMDQEEIKKKVKEHKMKRLKWTAIIVGACVAAIIVYYVVMQHMTYKDYRIAAEIQRSDTSATRYLEFNEGLLKYSNDGASYIDINNETYWNQSFEMENPMISIRQSYVAIADRQGEKIYLMNAESTLGEISVNMPISKIDIAAQGTLAVMMEESGTSYLSVFNSDGEQLAEGAIHMENGGTPMDIALSNDGKKLVVSIVDISGGVAKTVVNFYSFTSAGQNEVDNLMASYTYEDAVIPEVSYISDGTLVAYGDRGVYTYTGGDTPKEAQHLEVEEEIQSIFYDDTYFGLVFADTEEEAGRVIKVYDMKCNEQVSIHTEIPYDTIRFLKNHEICLNNETRCGIYTLGGLEKFTYEFKENIKGIFHEMGYRNYIILKDDATERARLKFFSAEKEDES